MAQHMKGADHRQMIVIHSPVSRYDIKSDNAFMHFSAPRRVRPAAMKRTRVAMNKDALPTLRLPEYVLATSCNAWENGSTRG
jgi:hypothetical protein